LFSNFKGFVKDFEANFDIYSYESSFILSVFLVIPDLCSSFMSVNALFSLLNTPDSNIFKTLSGLFEPDELC